jgi:hypothetical protein
MTKSQAHGFAWEAHIKKEVYKIQEKAAYTRKHDIDAHENTIDHCAVSIKTSGKGNVCMSDARRVYEATGGEPFHMVIVQYDQAEGQKILKSVLEVDLTGARALLFGDLTWEEISEFHEELRKIPRGRVQKEDKHYLSRSAELNRKSKDIQLNPKVDSTSPRRLQCSIPNIDFFCKSYPERLLYSNTDGVFKGVQLMKTLESGRRVRHPKKHE